MAAFDIKEILEVTGGSLIGEVKPSLCRGISLDTRTIKQGEVFVALKGERFDGHDYLQTAVDKGAALVVVEDERRLPAGALAIKVNDTLRALGDIARFHRRRFTGLVAAITGSNGKTTTKEMTAAVLASVWQVVKTEKNFNNEIGLPLTLLRLDEGIQACVLEMGMRGLGQIKSLADIAQPNLGVITNVGVTHMELLGTQDAIAQAKGELAEAIPDNGQLVLNADDPRVAAMNRRSNAQVFYYSLEKPADLTLVQRVSENNGQRLLIDGAWGKADFSLPALGRHNASNALAALLAGLAMGVALKSAVDGLSRLQLMDQRLRLITVPSGLRVIDDTYNSSPPAVEAALEVMDGVDCTGRRIVVLGDMLELGETAEQSHAQVGKDLARHRVDTLLAFGPLSSETARAAKEVRLDVRHYLEMEALVAELVSDISPEDLVLVKGSRGMRMERVVHALIGSERT
jgi:UDP-N-acetylmuramoyl-tripeptide--D-alanyl-D-alanine ligase